MTTPATIRNAMCNKGDEVNKFGKFKYKQILFIKSK